MEEEWPSIEVVKEEEAIGSPIATTIVVSEVAVSDADAAELAVVVSFAVVDVVSVTAVIVVASAAAATVVSAAVVTVIVVEAKGSGRTAKTESGIAKGTCKNTVVGGVEATVLVSEEEGEVIVVIVRLSVEEEDEGCEREGEIADGRLKGAKVGTGRGFFAPPCESETEED